MDWQLALLLMLTLFTAWLWWATKTVTGRLEDRIEKLEADLRNRTQPFEPADETEYFRQLFKKDEDE